MLLNGRRRTLITVKTHIDLDKINKKKNICVFFADY